MNYNISEFNIYANFTERRQHVMGYFHRDGECVIPDCTRTVKSQLGIDGSGKIVAFGTAKIAGEVVDLVKPDGYSAWHLNFGKSK